MSQLRAGVIGVGGMGKNHARVYHEIDQVDLVGVADIDPDTLHRITRSYGAPGYLDYREMLEKERLDLVSIAVPTRFHYEVANTAIQRGVHVLVEKPLAPVREEGLALIDMANQHGLILMVGHIERFNPAVTEVKRRLERNEIGKIFQMHARRLSPFPARIQDVGVILDLVPHDIDIMRYLLNAEVQRVYAEVERKLHRSCEDMVSGLLRFENGVIGVLDINWLTPTKVRQLEVIGEGGMYRLDYLTQDVYWYKNGDADSTWDTMSLLRGINEGDMVRVRIPKKEPLFAELEAFVNAVAQGLPSPVSGHDGLVALEIAQRLIDSGADHQPIMIQLEAQP